MTASAQSKFKAGTWSIQPKVGVTITSVTNMDNVNIATYVPASKVDNQVNVGATIGGEVEYQIDNRFSVAAGLGYIMQGKQWDDYAVAGISVKDTKLELGYINVPIVANFYVFKGLAVKAGMQFAFMTNAKFKSTAKEGNVETDQSVDIMDACNKFDFSIPVGVSYEFDNHIVIDARYNIGITNVNKDGNINCKNSVFLATVGYKFKL